MVLGVAGVGSNVFASPTDIARLDFQLDSDLLDIKIVALEAEADPVPLPVSVQFVLVGHPLSSMDCYQRLTCRRRTTRFSGRARRPRRDGEHLLRALR